MRFLASVLLGLTLGLSDARLAPEPPAPAIEFSDALPTDSQDTYITFQKSNITDPLGYYWIMVWENGINRTQELGPDAGFMASYQYTVDSLNQGSPAALCLPSKRWTGMPANFNTFCYASKSSQPLPNGLYDYAIYPLNASVIFASPGDPSKSPTDTWSMWPNDQYSEIDLLKPITKGTEAGTGVRITPTQGYLCLVKYAGGGTAIDTLMLYKYTGGPKTLLAKKAASSLWAAGPPIRNRCEMAGTTLKMSVGAASVSVVDASFRWGSPGIAQFYPIGNVQFMDNWAGGGLNNLRTIRIRVPPANPGQVRDYDVGIRAFDRRSGGFMHSQTSHIIWQRYNPPQSLPDTIKGAVVRLHVSANVPLFVDSVYVYYRVQLDTTRTVSPFYLLGRYPVRDTTINLPPILRGIRYTFLASMKPTITGTLMGATRDTNLVAKLQVHWTSP